MVKGAWVSLFLALSTAVIATGDLCAAPLNIVPTASIGQRYDDNIALAPSDAKADFVTMLSMGAQLDYESKRWKAAVSGNVTQSLFWKYTDDNNTAEFFDANIGYELSRQDRITLSDGFSHTYEPGSFAEEFARVGGRYSYFRNRLQVGYERDFTKEFRARVEYGYDTDIGSRADLLDSYVCRGSLRGDYSLGSKTALFAKSEFIRRTLDPGGDADTFSFGGGLQHALTQRLVFEAATGVDMIEAYDGRDYINPLWKVKLTEGLGEDTRVYISFSQRHETNPYEADVLKSFQVDAGMNLRFSKRLTGSVSIFSGQGTYKATDIEDDLFGGSAEVSYDISKNLRGTLAYTYSQTSSNVASREYARNLILFELSMSF